MLKVTNVNVIIRQGFWMKPKQILKNINLEISETGVYGILGANGAGKTTLIQLMVGLFPPTSGTVTLGGLSTLTHGARAKLGFLPERPYFYHHLKGRQFLKLMGTLMHMSRDEMNIQIPKVLEKVNLSHAIDLELSKYSKGMLQRMGIAQALLHNPDWIILDEPMSGLDPIGRRDIRKLIQELGAQGKRVIFSSHVLSDLESLAREIIILKNGEIIAQKQTSELLMIEADSRIELLMEDVRGDHLTLEANNIQDAQKLISEKMNQGFKLHRMTTQGSALEKWLQ
ncbi:MAG: ABC transporter ATP-binding protein [Xanthomonadaceae bacterium]|nr:ABC transporter ATP-binding protein [Xanthomonadaceae bacterium]